MKNVLTIAGSDSCGGAGIQADIKTISSLGAHAMSVITAITAQNSCSVLAIEELSSEIIEKQIEAIFEDIEVDAVKIGMLFNDRIIDSVEKTLKKFSAKNIVLDPVMISKSGCYLLEESAINRLKKFLPMATIITPNIPEAEALSGIKIETVEDMIESAFKIQKMGVKNILIKGGHLDSDCTDILVKEDKTILKFFSPRKNTKNTHGTGCTLSSAIATHLAKGYSLEESISKSKEYISLAIDNSFSVGHGVGPVGHFVSLYKKADIDF